MTFFEQWLVRITISGILTGLFVFIFWIIQNNRPALLSGRQKKLVWLILLFSACLVIPWPTVVYVPAPFINTIQTLRLPDYNQPRISSEQVQTSVENMNDYISAISQAENNNAEQEVTFEVPTDEIPRFIYRPALDFAAYLMRYWRIIYWVGLLLTIIGLLLQKIKVEYLRNWGGRYQRRKNKLIVLHAEKKHQGGFPDPESADNWTRVLSQWRDALGYYRRGQVKYQIEDPDDSSQIIKNWLGHQLPVPREISETDYPQYWQGKSAIKAPLALALYRTQHPDVVMSLLYCLVRVIYWFVPVWLWLHPLFQENLAEHRSQALARRLANKSSSDKPLSIKESKSGSLVILLGGVLLISFLLINMPYQLLPQVDRLDAQSVIRDGWQMNEWSFNGIADAVGTGNPLSALHGEISVSLVEVVEYGAPEMYLAKTILDQDGPTIDWWFHLNSAFGVRYFSPGHLQLIDYRIIGNRSLLLLFLTTDMTDRPETGTAVIMHLDLFTGSLARIRILENPLHLIREFCILANGDLLVIEWHRTQDLIDGRFFSSLVRPQEYRAVINRTDQNGELIWQIDLLDQGVNLTRHTWTGFSRVQAIDVIYPEKDGGFYLVINDNWIIHEGSSDADDLIYRNPGSLLRFDEAGQLLWQNQISDQHNHFIPDQMVINEQGQLFLSGVQIYQDAYFNLPSWADDLQSDAARGSARFQKRLRQSAANYSEAHVSGHIMSFSGAGDFLWQKNLAGAMSSQITDSLLVDDLLTISLNHWLPALDQPGLDVQKSLIRLDSDGEIDAWFDLPRSSAGQNEYLPVWLTRDQLFLSPEIIDQINEEQAEEEDDDQLPAPVTSFEIR